MKDRLAPYLNQPKSLWELQDLVISHIDQIKSLSPQGKWAHVIGPITANGRGWIDFNLKLLRGCADTISSERSYPILCAPYVGDLRRFPGMGEEEFKMFWDNIIRSRPPDKLFVRRFWRISEGTKAEMKAGGDLNIPMVFLTKSYEQKVAASLNLTEKYNNYDLFSLNQLEALSAD